MFKAKIDELRKSGRIGTMLVYDNVLKGVERFAGKNVLLEAVTTNWVRRYADFLRNEGKAQTTISINLRHLRALLNDAKRLGVLKESQYPFGRGRYEIQAGEGRKLALSQEQIATIAKYEDGTQATAKYRDYWLFLYLCNGINVADFVKLKYNNISDGEIHFVRQKTEFTTKTRKEISVVITQPMQTIIDRWGNTPPPRIHTYSRCWTVPRMLFGESRRPSILREHLIDEWLRWAKGSISGAFQHTLLVIPSPPY